MKSEPSFLAILLIFTALLSGPAVAEAPSSDETTSNDEDNYCHDQKVAAEWSAMLADAPEDPIVLKLYGLREGLCGMVDKGLVSLDQAAKIWELERVESAVQRFQEDAKRERKLIL